MTIKRIIDRQLIKSAVTTLGIADIGAANKHEIGVRPGTEVLRITVNTGIAFDTGSTGTAAATVTDGTTVFANAVDVKTAGSETVANVPKYYPTGGTISVSIAETVVTTAATVGAVTVVVEYVIRGNGDGGLEE